MRIAFGIVSLFPGGGLQRDCLAIAELVRNRGQVVDIYACRSQDLGDTPITLLPNDCYANHAIQYAFAREFLAAAAGKYDLVVGFDKLLDLDVLYCADPSVRYRARRQPYLYALSRYRTYAALERSSFGPGSRTRILVLGREQRHEYLAAWDTDPERVQLLPPTVTAARHRPEYRSQDARRKMRAALGCGEPDWVLMSVCVQPRTKGLDRVIRALPQVSGARLLVAGLSEDDLHAASALRLARRMGVSERIHWLGHREDIPQIMAAADLLVHPARYDTTGTVILEAIVNGLPVISSAACGYAEHVDLAGAGIVLEEPFDPRKLVAALAAARDPARHAAWTAAAAAYGESTWLYEGHTRAADTIVAAAEAASATRVAKLSPACR